jgi:hypothetical protein
MIMGFMERFVYGPMDGFIVETECGTEYVPGFVESDPEKLDQFFNGFKIHSVEKVHGYFGRYSAPGYLDCTDWLFGHTADEVAHDLDDLYGDDHDDDWYDSVLTKDA